MCCFVDISFVFVNTEIKNVESISHLFSPPHSLSLFVSLLLIVHCTALLRLICLAFQSRRFGFLQAVHHLARVLLFRCLQQYVPNFQREVCALVSC